ncbi:MAG TPA: preprotein translocase subunit SecE [Gaiellaceae bacterium]|jgi:preprotein translocase SecE subunit|nr:preprotein translocase subunit SecE [Gaiellaceae bacterium]
MARSSRQQRRARRAQTQPALAGGAPPPAPPATRRTAGAADEPSRRPQQHARERRIPFAGTVHFIQEAVGELKKVEWPNQQAVVSGTAVVMIACTIVGAYLWLNDRLWQYVVHHVLLR